LQQAWVYHLYHQTPQLSKGDNKLEIGLGLGLIELRAAPSAVPGLGCILGYRLIARVPVNILYTTISLWHTSELFQTSLYVRTVHTALYLRAHQLGITLEYSRATLTHTHANPIWVRVLRGFTQVSQGKTYGSTSLSSMNAYAHWTLHERYRAQC